MNIVRVLSVVMLVLCVSVQSVWASTTYTVAPLVIDETFEARAIETRTVTIMNTGETPVTIYPSVNNISLDAGGTIQEFLAPVESDRTRSLTAWMEFSRQGIDLLPGGKKTLTVTFRINPAPVPGVYHALLGFGYGSNRDEAERLVRNGQAPSIVVTVTIPDTTSRVLKLTRFIVDRFVMKSGNQAAVYAITNPGDEVMVPRGEIILYDPKGMEVTSLPVNTEERAIQPGETHEFAVEVPTDGLFGKYKAFLNVEYGSQRASMQDTAFFYVLPMKTLALVLGVLLTLTLLLSLYLHKRYFTEQELDDADSLPVRIRETTRGPMHHDIDLTKQ